MELPWDDDAVQGRAEVPRRHVPGLPRGDPRLIRSYLGEDADEGVFREGCPPAPLCEPEEIPNRLLRRKEFPAFLQVEQDEGVESPYQVLLNLIEGGCRVDRLSCERHRRGAPELVALKAEDPRGRADDAGSVDDPRRDACFMGPQAELDVGRRRHGIAGDQERDVPVPRRLQDLAT